MHGDMPEVETAFEGICQRKRLPGTLEALAGEKDGASCVEVYHIRQHGRLEGGGQRHSHYLELEE